MKKILIFCILLILNINFISAVWWNSTSNIDYNINVNCNSSNYWNQLNNGSSTTGVNCINGKLQAGYSIGRDYSDNNPGTISGSASGNCCIGTIIRTNSMMNLTSIIKHASATPTNWQIYNGSYNPTNTANTCSGGTNGTLLASGTFSGNLGSPSGGLILENNTIYSLVTYPASGSATIRYCTANCPPQVGNTSLINYVGSQNCGVGNDAQVRQVIGVNFVNISYNSSANMFYSLPTWLENLTNGLINYWSMNETTGNIINSVLNSPNGTMTGTIPNATGLKSGARGPYSASNWFEIAETRIDTDLPMAVSVWVKLNQTTQSFSVFYIGGNYGTTNDPIFFVQYNQITANWSFRADRWGDPGGYEVQLNYNMTLHLNEWTHIVVNYANKSNRSIIINSNLSLFRTSTSLATSSIASRKMEIGYNRGNSDTPFTDGIVDEFAMWNRTINYSEIVALYNNRNAIIYPLDSVLDYKYTNFIINLTANDNNSLVRVSSNNGLNWSNWYNKINNNELLTFLVPGNIFRFQINLTNITSTYSPTVSAFGMVNTSITGIIYSIIGQTLYNTSIIANSRLFLYNDNDIYLANTTSNSTGWYNFTSNTYLSNNTWYILDSRFSNSTINYTKSSYINILTNITNYTVEYYVNETGSTYYIGSLCSNYAQGYYLNQYNNGCYQVSQVNNC